MILHITLGCSADARNELEEVANKLKDILEDRGYRVEDNRSAHGFIDIHAMMVVTGV